MLFKLVLTFRNFINSFISMRRIVQVRDILIIMIYKLNFFVYLLSPFPLKLTQLL